MAGGKAPVRHFTPPPWRARAGKESCAFTAHKLLDDVADAFCSVLDDANRGCRGVFRRRRCLIVHIHLELFGELVPRSTRRVHGGRCGRRGEARGLWRRRWGRWGCSRGGRGAGSFADADKHVAARGHVLCDLRDEAHALSECARHRDLATSRARAPTRKAYVTSSLGTITLPPTLSSMLAAASCPPATRRARQRGIVRVRRGCAGGAVANAHHAARRKSKRARWPCHGKEPGRALCLALYLAQKLSITAANVSPGSIANGVVTSAAS